jgi:hypothetical protein
MKIVSKILLRKPEGNRSLGRSECKWEVNIRTNPRKLSWTDVTRNRDQWRALANTTLNLLTHKRVEFFD